MLNGGHFLIQTVTPEQVFTPEEFTKEHNAISKAVKEFVTGELISRGEEIEKINYELSRELMLKAGELGLLSADIPEEFDGMELDKISSALISERFGEGGGSFTLTELNHTGIGTLPVALFGTDEHKKKYLPGLASGELIGAFGLTEPEAGSDALNAKTTAELSKDGKYYILNGTKAFITNAGFGDLIFTMAKVGGKYFTCFIVEMDSEGISLDEEEDKMGVKGTSTCSVIFKDVNVPVGNVIAGVGKGHVIALNALNMGRFKVGAICIGNAKNAFGEAVRYSKQRVQFGVSICEFGLIKEKIADMAIQLFAGESMIYRTADLLQKKVYAPENNEDDIGLKTAKSLEEYLVECSIMKVFGTEAQDFVVDEAVQIFGGYGYIHGNPAELAYRNSRPNRIWEGSNEINRIVITSTLTKRADKGAFDLTSSFSEISEKIEKAESVTTDIPDNLDAQLKMLESAKMLTVFVMEKARVKYGKGLKNEQEVTGTISDMVIAVYSIESSILRAIKMLEGKKPSKAEIPVKMCKVLVNSSMEKMAGMAKKCLIVCEEGEQLSKDLNLVKKVTSAPPVNTIDLRRDISGYFIRKGRYTI